MIPVADLVTALNAEPGDATYIAQLLAAAVEYINEPGGRYFGSIAEVTENVVWRGGTFQLASEPVDGVFAVTKWSGSAWEAVDTAGYVLDGRLVFADTPDLRYGRSHLRVTYEAGYEEIGEEWDAPEDIKQAVRMLVAHWFTNREGTTSDEVKEGINMVLRKYR